MQAPPSKAPTVFLIIAILVLLIMVGTMRSRITNMEHNINHLVFQHSNEVRNLQWVFDAQFRAIEEQIAQLSRITFDESFQILSYNTDTLQANVQLGFNLKTFTPGDAVVVSAISTNGQVFEETATASGTGRFSATLSLPVQDNFTINVASMGTTAVSGHLMDLSLANRLSERFRYHLAFGMTTTSRNRDGTTLSTITFSPHLGNQTDGNPLLEIRSVVLEGLSGQEVVQTWDIQPYLRTEGQTQFLEYPHHFARDMFELDMAEITATGMTVIRLVMYDNLGIRYEQMDEIPFTRHNFYDRGLTFHSGTTTFFAPGFEASRMITPGEDSWHFIRMVR